MVPEKRGEQPIPPWGSYCWNCNGDIFRRVGTFLSSHYLAAEIASPTLELCGTRFFLI